MINYINISKINYSIFYIILIHFFYGFIITENAGGGSIDENTILSNFNLLNENNFFNINWNKYISSSPPFFYIFYNLIIDVSNYDNIRYLNLIISLCTFFIFFKSLFFIFKNIKDDESLLISSLLFLSPYFRTSTYFILEENFAVFLSVISFYFFLKFKNNLSYFKLIIILLFSSLSIYSRSNYIIFYIILFFNLLDYNKIYSKNNFFIIVFSFFLSIPGLYLIYKWQGFFHSGSTRTVYWQYKNIPIILNILIIYVMPFLFIKFPKISFKEAFYCLIFFPIYFFIFSNIQFSNFAGGAINKLFFLLFNKEYVNYLTIVSSYFSMLIIYFLFKKKILILSFILLSLIMFQNIDYIFQEYFDPITLIMLLLFGKFDVLQNKKIKYFLVFYFFLFYISSLTYQYKIMQI